MYIALWTEERWIDNPYWDPTSSNTEPGQVREDIHCWKKLISDKELIEFLDTKEGAKADFYTADKIFPELEKTVKLKITPSVTNS